MFRSDWAQDCTFTGFSGREIQDESIQELSLSYSNHSAAHGENVSCANPSWRKFVLQGPELPAVHWESCKIINSCFKPRNIWKIMTKKSQQQNPEILKKNPPPPPNFSLLYLKEIQPSWWLWDSWLWKQDQGRKPSPRARQWTASLFQNIREKEKEISRQKPPAELKCVLHGKDKHMSNTAFEFILSAPLNYINGNRDLDISIAALF